MVGRKPGSHTAEKLALMAYYQVSNSTVFLNNLQN